MKAKLSSPSRCPHHPIVKAETVRCSPPPRPKSAGMSKAALERVEAHLKHRYIEAGRFPGAQLVIYRRGKVVHSSVQGYADLERKVPVKDDTIFRIYSMTKPITSVAFMMLVEEGRVALDEPVAKYIPEWKNLGVFVAGTAPAFLTRPPSRPMLIVDLLRHTSGLTYGFQQRSNVDAAYREAKIGDVDASRDAGLDDRNAGKTPAGILAGRGLELFRLHRRDRLPDRQDQRQTVRPIPQGAHLRSARHERHRLLRAGQQGPSVRRLLFGRSARRHDVPRHRAQGHPHLAGRPHDQRRSSPRPTSFPAAADCARPRPTISPSAVR